MKNLKVNSNEKYFVIKCILLIWMGVFLFANGNIQSFWIDELSTIGYVSTGVSLTDMLKTYLFTDTNLPLYSILIYYVYRIVPYGEKFLLIPSILFTLLGVVMTSEAMEKIKNQRAGLITFCLCCASNAIIWQGAWEARCYSLVFFMSAVTLWAYIGRTFEKTRKREIIYTVSLLFFIWTHWFACILIAFYGVIDLIKVICKKESWKTLLCYLPAGLTLLPWLIISFLYKQTTLKSYWAVAPRWKDPVWTILFYVSGRRLLWYICLITGLFILVKYIMNLIFKKNSDIVLQTGALIVGALIWVIGIVFVYSRIINPEGSLYVQRYFMVTVPHTLLITAWGMEAAINYVQVRTQNIKTGKYICGGAKCVAAVLLAGYLILCYKEEYIAIRKPFEPFREAADYLIEERQIWDDDTLFVGSNKYCGLDGFIDYYFRERGYEPPKNIVSSTINSPEESRFYYNYSDFSEEELLEYTYVLRLSIHMGYDDVFMDFLERNYEHLDTKCDIEIWKKIER